MRLEIANIALNEKKMLKGFKVLGIFPFYLRYITTRTHIQLCKIREEIQLIAPDDIDVQNFQDSDLQARILPLVNKYCVTGLVNNRTFGRFFALLLNWKMRTCGHYHIFNLFFTINQLDDPAFFLSYWKVIKQKESTLLKEEKPS